MGSFQDDEIRVTKVLAIIFIILTVIANAALLLMYIPARRLLRGSIHVTRLTLSIGSILMAISSYLITVLETYDVYPPCAVTTLGNTYAHFLFPFVFGVAIILMTSDVLLHPSRLWSTYPTPIYYMMPVLPWILGLVIVCPLTLWGIDWGFYCRVYFTQSRANAMVVISRMIPVCLAALFTIVIAILCKIMGAGQAQISTILNTTATNSETFDFNNTNTDTARFDQTRQHQNQSLLPRDSSSDEMQPLLYVARTNILWSLASRSASVDVLCLLWTSLVFFFSVMPFTCYMLRRINNIIEDDKDEAIARDVCFFISWLYPTIVPYIWIRQITQITGIRL